MAIETLTEYLNRKKQEDNGIETLENYAKKNNIAISYDYLEKRKAEEEAKINSSLKKKSYNDSLKKYQSTLNKSTVKFPSVTGLNKNNLSSNISDNLSNKKSDLKITENEEIKRARELAQIKENELRIAKNDYEQAKENNKDITFLDKTIGVPIRGAKDVLGAFFSPTDNISTRTYKDENGNQKVLSSTSEIKQQHVSENYDTVIGKFLGDVGYNASKVLTAQAVNALSGGMAGTALYWADMFNDNLVDTINKGYTKEQALLYSSLSTISEALTEKVLGGLSKITPGGTSEMSKTINNSLSKYLKNDRLRSSLSNAFSEGTEEFIQEYIDMVNRNLVLNEDMNLDKEQLDKAIYSGLVGMASGGYFGAKDVEIKTNNTGVFEEETTSNNKEITKNSMNENKSLISTSNTDRFQYKPTLSVKKNNFMDTAYKYLGNSQGSIDFVNTVNKVIDDKGYNILLDNNITNNKGQSVNAKISNVNGEVEIRINPNSERAGEFLLTHEITHAIETDSMKKLVLDYASKNSEFNNALESLKQTYGTNDVSSEVLADISGQLFGNQEFINSLSMEQPNVFKKIYNKIVEIANKITGNSKESLFIKDLKNKWEETYRNTTMEQAVNNLSDKSLYSIQNYDNIGIVAQYDNKDFIIDSNKNIAWNIRKYFNDNLKNIIINNKTLDQARKYSTTGTNYKTYESVKAPSITILDDIINSSNLNRHETDRVYNIDGRLKKHSGLDTSGGFNHYDVKIGIPDNGKVVIYNADIITRIDKNNKEYFYDLGKIKDTGHKVVDNKSKPIQASVSNTDNISQIDNSVNSDTSSTKYSMQESKNNTQELDNSSFNFLKNNNGNQIDITNLKENDIMKRYHYNRKYEKNSINVYRGVSEDSGTNPAFYGLGLYTTLDKNYANKYGNVIKIDSYLLPDKPLMFRTQNDFSIWEQQLAKELGIRKSELYSNDYGVEQYIKKIGYDGLMIGTGKDTDLISFKDVAIKYSQNNQSWQEHLENNYKAKGTRTNFKDIKILPNVKKTNIAVLPTINNSKNKNINKTSISEKIENNLKTIVELNKAKDESNSRIDLKIKEKRELYQSKKNKNTKLANILQQQAIALENQKKSVEMAYIHRIEALEERNKKINSKEYRINEQKKSKSLQYREEAEELIINDIGNWEDKTAGWQYKRETMERNIKDIIPNKEVSQKVVDEYIKPVYKATATMEKYVTYYNNEIKTLNLSKDESIAVQMLGEGKYNGIKPIKSVTEAKSILNDMYSKKDLKQSAQLCLDAVDFIENNNLDINKIENGIKTFRNIYDNIFNQVNNVLKEQGYKEMDYRKDYFPHFTKETSDSKIGKFMEKLGWKNKNNNLPTDIAGITEQFKPGKTYFSHANRRYGNITEYNALEGFDTYIRGASEQIYLTEPIQKLRALENEIRYLHSEKGIQEKYEEITNSELDEDSKEAQIQLLFQNAKTPLNNFVTELRSYTDNIANKKSELDRRTEHLFNRRIYSTMTNIQSRVSANMVGLNISSAITNFIPITQAWSQISTKNLLKAMKSSISNSIKNDGFENNSEFLTNRLHKADHLYKTTLDKISDKTGIIFEAVDNFTSNVIVRGKYFENIEKGMSKTDALKNANAFGRNIMAARDKGSLPTAFNAKNPILKLFTSFQVEVNNQYSYMLKDLPNDLKDEGVKRLVGAFVKMFLGAYLYNLISDKITGRKSAFSPADMVIDSIKTIRNDNISTYDKLSGITEDIVGEVPFVGGLLGGGRLPISSALPSLSTTTKSVINLSDADKRKTAIRDLAKEFSKPLFYIFPPFAGGQAKKTVEGLSMYANKIPGSYTTSGKLRFEAKTDPLSIAQNAIFGQYSSKEAREYFDKGYTSLSEKQQEVYENLNIPMETYRNYLSDLSDWNNIKADKDEEGNSIAGTALAKKVYEMMNNEKKYSEDDINFYLSKLSDTEDPIGFEDIIKIDNDVDVYKYYFSLSRESKDKYISYITNFKFNQNKYIENIKEINSISKKYSELSKATDNQQQKTNISNQKKNEIWQYIQNLELSKVQKIIFYAQSGYSITQYKSYMHDYINNLNIAKSEKEKIWKELY